MILGHLITKGVIFWCSTTRYSEWVCLLLHGTKSRHKKPAIIQVCNCGGWCKTRRTRNDFIGCGNTFIGVHWLTLNESVWWSWRWCFLIDVILRASIVWVTTSHFSHFQCLSCLTIVLTFWLSHYWVKAPGGAILAVAYYYFAAHIEPGTFACLKKGLQTVSACLFSFCSSADIIIIPFQILFGFCVSFESSFFSLSFVDTIFSFPIWFRLKVPMRQVRVETICVQYSSMLQRFGPSIVVDTNYRSSSRPGASESLKAIGVIIWHGKPWLLLIEISIWIASLMSLQ